MVGRTKEGRGERWEKTETTPLTLKSSSLRPPNLALRSFIAAILVAAPAIVALESTVLRGIYRAIRIIVNEPAIDCRGRKDGRTNLGKLNTLLQLELKRRGGGRERFDSEHAWSPPPLSSSACTSSRSCRRGKLDLEVKSSRSQARVKQVVSYRGYERKPLGKKPHPSRWGRMGNNDAEA